MTSHLDMNVNPFSSDSSEPFDAKSQKTEKAESLNDPLVQKILELYPTWMGYNLVVDSMVLSPANINLVLQLIFERYPKDEIESHHTGMFISRLMQISYDNGHNDFVIQTQDYSMDVLPSVKGRNSQDMVRYTLVGNTGEVPKLEYCIGQHRNGDVKRGSFYESEGSKLEFFGYVGDRVGFLSSNCEFIFHGDVGYNACPDVKDCIVTFYGNAKDAPGLECKSSTFRAVFEKVFKNCVRNIIKGGDNTVQLINPDGTVIREVKV